MIIDLKFFTAHIENEPGSYLWEISEIIYANLKAWNIRANFYQLIKFMQYCMIDLLRSRPGRCLSYMFNVIDDIFSATGNASSVFYFAFWYQTCVYSFHFE